MSVRARRKKLFLEAYAEAGTISAAAREAGVDRSTHYRWLEADLAYGAAFALAHERAVDSLEAELIRRGRDGYDEPVFQGGKKVGEVRKYSDACLIFALKGALPEKYRERVSIVSEESIDAEIARLSAQLGRGAQAGEAAPLALPPGSAGPG